MKINKIKKLKNNRYELQFDNYSIITYDDIIIKYNLLYKKNIDNKLLKEISDYNKYYDSYNDALKYATKKCRCEREIFNYLKDKELNSKEIESIINKLKESHIINDKLYARSYINDKLLFSKLSLSKIKEDLITNNISSDIIDEEINQIDYDEIDRLTKLISKKVNTNHKYSSYILKNKIVNEMVSLGYNYNDISVILDDLLISFNDYDYLLKEYKKIYSKYSKKYSDYELEKIIKSKLYSKGFKYEDIKKEDLF